MRTYKPKNTTAHLETCLKRERGGAYCTYLLVADWTLSKATDK